MVLGFFWIIENEEFTEKNLHFSISLVLFTTIALILERPWYELTKIEYDKISIVHLFVFCLIGLFWILYLILGISVFLSARSETSF